MTCGCVCVDDTFPEKKINLDLQFKVETLWSINVIEVCSFLEISKSVWGSAAESGNSYLLMLQLHVTVLFLWPYSADSCLLRLWM